MPPKIDHEMLQNLLINDEILTANLSVEAEWQVASGAGLAEFIVILRKPDSTDIELFYQQYTDGASGKEYIIQNLNVKPYMTQQGTYKLRLLCGVKSNDANVRSYGWYDNISLYVTLKKKKTIVENIGAVETSYSGAKKAFESLSDDLGLDEALNTKLLAKRTFADDAIGIKEILKAKLIMGNVERVYEFADLAEWDEIEKKKTRWRKKKTVIN